jgi:hypothetical protein
VQNFAKSWNDKDLRRVQIRAKGLQQGACKSLPMAPEVKAGKSMGHIIFDLPYLPLVSLNLDFWLLFIGFVRLC